MDIVNSAKRSYSAELNLLGVDTTILPSITCYPRTFSREGFSLWKALIEEGEYASKKIRTFNYEEVWYSLIKRFLKLCTTNGIFPFARSTQQANNETITNFLATSRQRIKLLFTQSDFLSRVKIRSVVRDYEFHASSFQVTSTAILKPIEDPTFVKWVQSRPFPMFLHGASPGLYEKKVHANVFLHAHLANLKQPKLSLTIFCHTPIALVEQTKLPSLNQMRQLAESTLWTPLVRSNPFPGAGSKLF